MILRPDDFLFDGKLILGEHERIGYVSQFNPIDSKNDKTVFDYIAQEFMKVQAQMDELCDQMGTADDIEPLLEQYQLLVDAFDAMDGHNYANNISKKLAEANLSKLENMMVSSLSGPPFSVKVSPSARTTAATTTAAVPPTSFPMALSSM